MTLGEGLEGGDPSASVPYPAAPSSPGSIGVDEVKSEDGIPHTGGSYGPSLAAAGSVEASPYIASVQGSEDWHAAEDAQSPPMVTPGMVTPGESESKASGRRMSVDVRKAMAKWNPVEWITGGIGNKDEKDDQEYEAEGEEDGDGDFEEGDEEYYDDGLVKVDPQATKHVLSSRINQGLAIFNILMGILYLTWRIMRGFTSKPGWLDWELLGKGWYNPDDPEQAWNFKVELQEHWWAWVILFTEALLMMGVWLTHVTRIFPIKRTRCTMNDLVDADYDVSKITHTAIVLPTRGEPLSTLREVILSTMSLHLWPGKLDVRRNLRLVIIDDARRSEVKLLLGLCYRFAALFCNNRKVRQQLKQEGKGEMSLVGFYEFYLQCTAGFARAFSENFEDVFEIADMIQKICRENCVPSDWDGLDLPSGRRVEPTSSFMEGALRLPRTREDFNEIRNVPYAVYFARPNACEPAMNPFAGCVNSVLFPEDSADTDILGGAKFIVLNDPDHALQPEFLQRTIPYFFELYKTKRKAGYRICKEVAFVQVALRYKELKAKDPLGLRNLMLYDIKNVGRDGVGAAMACRHGVVYRVEVLQAGKSAKGKPLVEPEQVREHVGRGLGLAEITRLESLPTSIQLFQRGYRSVYVNEPGETLSVCLEPVQDLDARIQQVFNTYMSAMDVLVSDPMTLMSSSYTTKWHRVIIVEELWHGLILGLATEGVIACIVMYSIIWHVPFNTHGMEFLLYFLTYYVSAALPTAVGLNWKRTAPDHAFRLVQLGVATAYVPLVAYVGGALSEASRVVCSRSGIRQFVVEGAPTWPLFATVVLLLCSLVINFIKWAQHHFAHAGLWMTAMVMSSVALGMLYPSAARGLRFKGLANFYSRYFTLGILIIVVALWQGADPGSGMPRPKGK